MFRIKNHIKPILNGALGGTRTPDTLVRSQVLYPLSYERAYAGAMWD